jgi:hypothetical protein
MEVRLKRSRDQMKRVNANPNQAGTALLGILSTVA